MSSSLFASNVWIVILPSQIKISILFYFHDPSILYNREVYIQLAAELLVILL